MGVRGQVEVSAVGGGLVVIITGFSDEVGGLSRGTYIEQYRVDKSLRSNHKDLPRG